MRSLADPFVSSVLVLVGLAGSGIAMLALAWRGVAAEVAVANQVSFLVSGAIGGLGLLGFATGVVVIQHRRLTEARRRAEVQALIEAAAALSAEVRRDSGSASR